LPDHVTHPVHVLHQVHRQPHGALLLGDGAMLICERSSGIVRRLPRDAPGGSLEAHGEALPLDSEVNALFRLAPDTILLLYRTGGAADLRPDTGEPLRTVSYAADLPATILRRPLGALRDGVIVYELWAPGTTAAQIRALASREGPTQIPIELVGVAASGDVQRIHTTTGGVEHVIIEDGQSAVLQHPLAERPLFAVGAGGLFVGNSHDGKVRRYAADGSITGEWQWPGVDRNATEDEIERIRLAYIRDGIGPTPRHREQLFVARPPHGRPPRRA
jgi:hypothetical protein